jgi:hypothetical protein
MLDPHVILECRFEKLSRLRLPHGSFIATSKRPIAMKLKWRAYHELVQMPLSHQEVIGAMLYNTQKMDGD